MLKCSFCCISWQSSFRITISGEWDLWEESSGNYVPLREREAACLDYAVFISHKGEEYYRSKYPQSKTVVYPLGSKDYGIQKEARTRIQ